ncbi:MAG: FIST signal transduction protein [Candidatus Methanospirareceae archaeon]
MKVGVAYSKLDDSHRAGRNAAEDAVESSGKPVLTFLFTTDSYNQEFVLEAVKEVVGESKIVGFCGGGVITSEGVFRHGVGVCTLSGDELRVATSLQGGLSEGPRDVGRRAGEELLASGMDKGTVFVLIDGFGTNISEAIRGLYSRMGPYFRYVGGGAGDNLKFFKTFQFTEAGIKSDALAAALLDGLSIQTGIGHGWKPEGDILVINDARGKRVFEIDGRPAFDAYSERLGGIEADKFPEYGMRHPLGFPDISGNYLIRDPLSVNPDKSIDFVTEIPRNAVGNIMNCDVRELIETAGSVAKTTAQKVEEPQVALLFDCISRCMLMGKEFGKELEIIKESIGIGVPILGALTFGEVGSYVDVPQFHNKTVAIAVGGDKD